jgi:hypothetical protein
MRVGKRRGEQPLCRDEWSCVLVVGIRAGGEKQKKQGEARASGRRRNERDVLVRCTSRTARSLSGERRICIAEARALRNAIRSLSIQARARPATAEDLRLNMEATLDDIPSREGSAEAGRKCAVIAAHGKPRRHVACSRILCCLWQTYGRIQRPTPSSRSRTRSAIELEEATRPRTSLNKVQAIEECRVAITRIRRCLPSKLDYIDGDGRLVGSPACSRPEPLLFGL